MYKISTGSLTENHVGCWLFFGTGHPEKSSCVRLLSITDKHIRYRLRASKVVWKFDLQSFPVRTVTIISPEEMRLLQPTIKIVTKGGSA
jgi:hypothetical protein